MKWSARNRRCFIHPPHPPPRATIKFASVLTSGLEHFQLWLWSMHDIKESTTESEGEKKHVNKGTSSGRPRGEAERNKAIGRDILYLGDRLGSEPFSEWADSRVQWFWLFFTFWGITTHPWHPKGPRIWKLAKKNVQLYPWPAEIFGKNRKMRFFGLV